MYVSTQRMAIKEEYEKTKSPGKLFGPPGAKKPDPKNFTKKGAGATKRTAAKGERFDPKKTAQTVLAPGTGPRPTPSQYVPRHTEKAALAPRTKKNFVKDNYKTALTNKPKRSADKQSFKGTGKVPAYITKRNEEIRAEQEMQATLRAEAQADNGLAMIPDDEKRALLSGLKSNHAALQKIYLGLSVVVDTIPKKEKKQAIEAQLAEFEKDINLLERNNTVYVRT